MGPPRLQIGWALVGLLAALQASCVSAVSFGSDGRARMHPDERPLLESCTYRDHGDAQQWRCHDDAELLMHTARRADDHAEIVQWIIEDQSTLGDGFAHPVSAPIEGVDPSLWGGDPLTGTTIQWVTELAGGPVTAAIVFTRDEGRYQRAFVCTIPSLRGDEAIIASFEFCFEGLRLIHRSWRRTITK